MNSNEPMVHLEVPLVLNFLDLFKYFEILNISLKVNNKLLVKCFGGNWRGSLSRIRYLVLKLTPMVTLIGRTDRLRPSSTCGSGVYINSSDCKIIHSFYNFCEELKITLPDHKNR